MGNVYFIDLDTFGEADAVYGRNIGKDDKVIFLPNESGYMDYTLIPYLMSWETELLFTPPISGPKNNYAILFSIAMQCADLTGEVYIISKEEMFLQLDGYILGSLKGDIVIHATSCLSGLEKGHTEPEEAIQKPKFSYYGKNPDSDYRQAPDAFIERLKEIEQEKEYPLLPYANALFESIKESTDGVIATLEFQLQLRIEEEHVTEFMDALSEYSEELCEFAR